LIIEGAGTRFGVGNGLFDNATGVYRIVAPSKNAYKVVGDIEKAAVSFINRQEDRGRFIVLIALGPTATVLVGRMCELVQTIDIGHFDLQYEYLTMGKFNKVKVPTRYNNEMLNGDTVKDIDDDDYSRQIICNLSE
jgi:hypothetical protein